MNVTSLNNVWTYLQGLTLTAGNKRWLADRLYESSRQEKENRSTENSGIAVPHLLSESELPEIVRDLIGVAAPTHDGEVRDVYYSHLAQKNL